MSANSEKWSEYRARASSAALLSGDEERCLLVRAQRGDAAAVRELVASHLRLVLQVVRRYQRAGLSVDDLVSEGVVGLLEALKRFDPVYGARFATYAREWVRAWVQRFALANRRMVAFPASRVGRSVASRLGRIEHDLLLELGRAPTSAELAGALGVHERDVDEVRSALAESDLSLDLGPDHPLAEARSDELDPEGRYADLEARRALRHALDEALGKLSQRERTLVRELYESEDAHSATELARDLGVTRQRVHQIALRAREKLRTELAHVA